MMGSSRMSLFRLPLCLLALSGALAAPGRAQAADSPDAKPDTKTAREVRESKGVYTGKVALTAFYYTENDGVDVVNDPTLFPMRLATSSTLGYGELRAIADARRVANEKIDFRLDVRLRVTGNFDFERKFDPTIDTTTIGTNNLGTSSRGYLGGPEYDLREAYVNVHFTPRIGLQIGRMFVREADNIKLDGLRLFKDFGPHWQGSAFLGGYPNPYSRSLLTDYVGPCGAGVAGDRNDIAISPCTTEGAKLGLGFGVGARYSYDRLWGSIGLVGSLFTGVGDGGVVTPDPAAKPYDGMTVLFTQPNLNAPDGSLDAPRVFLSWLNSWRPAERFDLFSDLVVDAYGSAGPQLTRLILLGTIRILRDDRLTMRTGFSYMSSLAINMYLNRLVYNRLSGTTLTSQGISAVENNLTVLRTGRAEGRVTLDARFVRRLGGFVEGRVRYRSLINGGSDPSVYNDKSVDGFNANVPTLAGDASIGIRDTGSLAGIRGGLVYSAIIDYLSQNHVINFDIGRDFWNERIGLTLNYVAAITKDAQSASIDTCTPLTPYTACFGRRSGMTHELGLQATANPWRTLFFVIDYRLIAMLTDAQNMGADKFPTVLSHAILFRTEFRW